MKYGQVKIDQSFLIWLLKFVFSKKATKIDEIFTVDLTVNTYCQIDGEDFVNFCDLLRKREIYISKTINFVQQFEF